LLACCSKYWQYASPLRPFRAPAFRPMPSSHRVSTSLGARVACASAQRADSVGRGHRAEPRRDVPPAVRHAGLCAGRSAAHASLYNVACNVPCCIPGARSCRKVVGPGASFYARRSIGAFGVAWRAQVPEGRRVHAVGHDRACDRRVGHPRGRLRCNVVCRVVTWSAALQRGALRCNGVCLAATSCASLQRRVLRCITMRCVVRQA
jgi:hypothetical protein